MGWVGRGDSRVKERRQELDFAGTAEDDSGEVKRG